MSVCCTRFRTSAEGRASAFWPRLKTSASFRARDKKIHICVYIALFCFTRSRVHYAPVHEEKITYVQCPGSEEKQEEDASRVPHIIPVAAPPVFLSCRYRLAKKKKKIRRRKKF